MRPVEGLHRGVELAHVLRTQLAFGLDSSLSFAALFRIVIGGPWYLAVKINDGNKDNYQRQIYDFSLHKKPLSESLRPIFK